MLLEKKELTKLRKSAEKKLNEKIEKIKFFSINTITNEIDNIQLSYENEDYTFFANIADDIIFSNASDEYKDDFSTHEHNENVLELAKLITQDYIVKLKILIQNNYLILDSEKSSAAQGLLVLKTQEDVDLGLSLKEVLNNFKERVKNTFVFFMYDEPKWLKAGGRFPKIAQIGLQKIKDFNVSLVLREKGGVIRPVAFKKNATNLVDPLFDEFKKFTKGVEKRINVVITHGDDMIQANKLRKKLETLKNVKVLYIKLLDIVLGAHIGPNALVINFEYD